MATEASSPAEEHSPKNSHTEASCERCGSFEVLEIAGQFLCADCVSLVGCGCAGHGDEEE